MRAGVLAIGCDFSTMALGVLLEGVYDMGSDP